jgi:hypothetical protein
MIPVPLPGDANDDALRRLEKDRFTGVAGAVITLTQNPQEDYLFIWKNGLLLDIGVDWTVLGTTVTFVVPLVGGDVVWAIYWTRAS